MSRIDPGATCLNCTFWEPNKGDTDSGECRREGPRLFELSSETSFFGWPMTKEYHWCGGFRDVHAKPGAKENQP